MTTLTARIEGTAFWTRGLPSWDAAVAFADGPLHDDLAIVVVRASLQDPDAPADAVVG